MLSMGFAPVLALICPLLWSFATPLLTLSIDWIVAFFSGGNRMTIVVKDKSTTTCILEHFHNASEYSWLYELVFDGQTTLSGHVFSWKHKVWAYVDHSKADTDRGSEPCITLYYILQGFFKELASTKKDSCKVDESLATDDEDDDDVKTVEMFRRMGPSYNYYYKAMQVPIFYTEMPAQTAAIDFIWDAYNANHRRLSVFIYGEPGTGKSWMTILLALRANASYCKSFNPSNPGDHLVKLVSQSKPTKVKPLVINHNEVNGMIYSCHTYLASTGAVNSEIATCYNKQSYNDYCDDFELMPQNIIMCGTSNKTPAEINSWCGSYLRGGRIHLVVEFISRDKVQITKQLKPNCSTKHIFGDHETSWKSSGPNTPERQPSDLDF